MAQALVVQDREEKGLTDTGTGCLGMAGDEQLDRPPSCSGCGFGSCLGTEACGSWRLGRFGGCAAPASLVLVPWLSPFSAKASLLGWLLPANNPSSSALVCPTGIVTCPGHSRRTGCRSSQQEGQPLFAGR